MTATMPRHLLRPSEYAVFAHRGEEMHLRMHLREGTKLHERGGSAGNPEVVVTAGGRLAGINEDGSRRGRSYVILTITEDDPDDPFSTRHTVTTQGSTGHGGRRHRTFAYGHEAVSYALKWLDRRYRLQEVPS